MTAQVQDLIGLWLAAADEPIGLLLRSSDPGKAKQLLYRARTAGVAQGHTALAHMQLRTSPFPDGDLVICRGQATQAQLAKAEDLGL